jgi:MYXO-CTERM domain-containing protein
MHAYSSGGSFTVTLTVTDNDNLTASATAGVSIADGSGAQPPLADAGGPYAGTTGVAIQFDGSGSSDPDGTIAGYAWDFGDGGTATGVRPTHAYAAAGRYAVSLTVTDNGGATSTAGTSAEVSDANRVPAANPGGPYAGQPGVAVRFDGRGSSDPDGSVAAYAWDFGDGSTGSGATPEHTYAAIGVYTVSLVVTDNAGADSVAATTRVNIEAPSALTGGEALYSANCEVCHGGPWNGPAVDSSLSGMKRVAGARSCSIEGAIFGTSVFPDGVPAMVSFGSQSLTADEIGQIAEYLNSQPASGEQRYVAACAGCHGNDGHGGRVDQGVRGEDAGDIREAIHEERGMTFLSCLPASDLELMAAFLGGSGNGQCDDDCDEEEDEDHDRSHCLSSDDCDGDGRRDETDDDDDNDRMPDSYEDSHGFDPYDPTDADEDQDRDGKSNLEEYLAGTNPLQATAQSDDSSTSGGGGSIGVASLLGLFLLALIRHRQRPRLAAGDQECRRRVGSRQSRQSTTA